MSLKSFLFLKFAQWKVAKELEMHSRSVFYQNQFLNNLLRNHTKTLFGKEHSFHNIKNYTQFKSSIPIRNYEEFLPFIEKIKKGEKNILTKKDPIYLLMTSGTTAGSKYIPITQAGIKKQIDAALKVLCYHAVNSGNADFIDNKMIFLQGSPELDYSLKIPAGRLSGVVYHHIPKFFQKNKLPSYEANIIEDWQKKLDAIVEESYREDISILGGIPPWCLQYFEKLLGKSEKNTLKHLYPNLAIYIHGGLDYSNYKERMKNLVGEGVAHLQTFPASEGFFALQDKIEAEDMLLLLNQGIFYEFRTFNQELEDIVSIDNVKLYTRYELIITNDSGLYRYAMGDLIEFTSLAPYRIKVVGRTSQFISAFGEHVIASEVEKAIELASANLDITIADYYVRASVAQKKYIWYIEFTKEYSAEIRLNLAIHLDKELSSKNKYYAHLIRGCIINPCEIVQLSLGSLDIYRDSKGKLGGQNKIVRLGMEKMDVYN
jgi:hypothetical protein